MGMLDKRVAIVTGAASGIGEGCALKFAEEGAIVVACDIAADKLQSVVDKINQQGGQAIAIRCDIGEIDDINNVVDTAINEFGTVDILANIAQGGLSDHQYLENVSAANAQDAFNTGPLQTMHFMQRCLPVMKQQNYGRIINTASHAAVYGNPGFAAYGMAKGAIMALTRIAAKEWGGYGITTNVFLPVLHTPAFDLTPQSRAAAMGMAEQIPVGYFGKPYEDCSPILTFIASESAKYLNGQVIGIDGGKNLIA